jgi:N-acetyl-anhydromuramyl-L-alanine amidase AmpD
MAEKLKIKDVPAAVQNFTKSLKPGRTIKYIIVHVMQGTLVGTTAWFKKANPARASAHYSIGVKGDVVRHVQDADIAHHAGNWAYNKVSVGIELEGYVDKLQVTDAMMTSLVQLCQDLQKTYGVSGVNIIGHCDVPHPKDPKKKGGAHGHTDPGPKFPWDTFRAKLNVL